MSTQAKIGYGINNQTLVSFDYDAGIIIDSDADFIFTTNSFTVAGTYFMMPETASPFIIAGAGFTTASVTDANPNSESESINGLSLKFGGGYQFSDQFQLEAAYLTNSMKEPDIDDFTYSLSSVQIKLQYVSYNY